MMIAGKVQSLEAEIRNQPIDDDTREDLLGLTGTITGAIPTHDKEKALESARTLRGTVGRMENASPRLTSMVNEICVLLADIGI